MSQSEALKTARLLIALRDAIREASEWNEVKQGLKEQGVSLDEIRARLRPRIEFDPHCHTVHSDGQFTYEQLLWWCKATGLPGLAVTDHDNINPAIGDAIEAGEVKVYNLGNGEGFSVKQVIDTCRDVTGTAIELRLRRGSSKELHACQSERSDESCARPAASAALR